MVGVGCEPIERLIRRRGMAYIMFERTKDIAGLVRDIGVIVGVPVIITVGIFLYDLQSKSLEQQAKALEQQVKSNEAQIKTLEAQNNLLKETQYDRALAIIKSQKEVYEIDRARLEKEIAVLRISNDERVKTLEAQIEEYTKKIQVSNDIVEQITVEQTSIERAALMRALGVDEQTSRSRPRAFRRRTEQPSR
jgi:hypothetical protein